MILKAADGSTYRVRWRVGSALHQKTFRSKEAERRHDAQMTLRGPGRPRREVKDAVHPKITVRDFAEQVWLKRIRSTVQPKTLASYEETLRRYILRVGVGIASLEVRDVAREDIEEMLQSCSAKSRAGVLSRNTLRIIRDTCSSLFDQATRVRTRDGDHLLRGSPCSGVKLTPQASRPRSIRAMTYEQVEQFLKAAKRHHPYDRKEDRWLAGR